MSGDEPSVAIPLGAHTNATHLTTATNSATPINTTTHITTTTTTTTKRRHKSVRFEESVILLDSAGSGDLAVVQTLLEQGKVSVEASSPTGLTALCRVREEYLRTLAGFTRGRII
jgi:hypothetical protein